ncbi:AAA-domain-containing protein [Auricularia subglabra TFB-10046 SS5]|nr:AAA-domain-containing protein [Auricularia subglabra TFB-10046 SS5]
MPRQATIRYVSLRSSLVNLPLSLYGPLVEHRVRPQGVAVHLSAKVNGKTVSAHVGWTGLASASSLAQWQNRLSSAASSSRDASFETLEIDPQFATSLGFPENAIVEIGLLHDLPVATQVATEPRTADDWEIMELHANYMEESLLSQVRVAVVGQEIDAWVLGRTRVRFLVVSTEPSNGPCLLSTDTEVSIAPKPRSQPTRSANGNSDERPKAISAPSGSSDARSVKQTPTSATLRVLPLARAASPQPASVSTLFVSPHMFSHIASAAGTEGAAFVRIKVLRPPFSAPDNHPATPKPDDTRVFKPQEASDAPSMPSLTPATTKINDVDTSVVARLVIDAAVPSAHAVAIGTPSISTWDLISVMPAASDGEPARIVHQPEPIVATPNSLAGVSAFLDRATEYVLHGFAAGTCAATGSVAKHRGVQGLLLVGRPGSGRTSVAKAVAQRLQDDTRIYAQTLYKDMTAIAEDRVQVVKAEWTSLLERASWSRPSVIILDNLDVLIDAELEHADTSRQRQLAEQFLAVFGSARDLSGVAVIAVAKGTANLHPLLSTSHIFGLHLTLAPPNLDARRDILSELVKEHIAQSDLQLDVEDVINYVALATTTEGYSATDLKDLVAGAVHHAAMRDRPALGARDFEHAQKEFVPLSLRDVQQTKRTEVRWADIGGLGETRRVLRETLEWPTKYSAIFAECPLRLRSGLLLYGYPGCGKTLLASAVARECGLNFIGVKGPELLNKYIGASEKSVRDLFERATAAKPCILFFDEFDSIAPKRGHDSTGVTDRVVNQMLTQMDGAEGLDGVYVLAATSRPDLIDPALLRPGRLDKALLCNMPDMNERQEILDVVAGKLTVSPEVDLSEYAAQTEGYSGADLQALLYNAHLDAVHESIAQPLRDASNGVKPGEDTHRVRVTSFGGTQGSSGNRLASAAENTALERRMAAMLDANSKGIENKSNAEKASVKPKIEIHDGHLVKALRGMKPSLPIDERLRLDFIYDQFRVDRSGALPQPGAGNGVGQRTSLM